MVISVHYTTRFDFFYSVVAWLCLQKDCVGMTHRSQKNRRYGSPSKNDLMMPTQLQRSFINQFLDPKKSHHLAPRPFTFTHANNIA